MSCTCLLINRFKCYTLDQLGQMHWLSNEQYYELNLIVGLFFSTIFLNLYERQIFADILTCVVILRCKKVGDHWFRPKKTRQYSWAAHVSLNCLPNEVLEMMKWSLLSGIFPAVLTAAVIKPLLKKGNLDATVIANYRPISNLPFLSKVLDMCAVLQSSILGPLLLNLYMLTHVIKKHTINYHNYADDSQLYISLSPNDRDPIHSLIQCIDINLCMSELFTTEQRRQKYSSLVAWLTAD